MGAKKKDRKYLVFVTSSNGICTCHVEIYRINVFYVECFVPNTKCGVTKTSRRSRKSCLSPIAVFNAFIYNLCVVWAMPSHFLSIFVCVFGYVRACVKLHFDYLGIYSTEYSLPARWMMNDELYCLFLVLINSRKNWDTKMNYKT